MTELATDGTASAVKKKSIKVTKRQKRKQPSEKNKWPQHPKIQDMDVRSKAYIRVAGLGSSTKKKETIDAKLDLMSPEVKFGRLLGGTDQRNRHAAVQKLKAYLKARCDINNEDGGISEMDLLKLWKGLWYTLYMADKVPVQEELAKHLSQLLWCVAGTEEEDEYAGQAYMDMCEADEREDEGDSDDDAVMLEEVENTLEDANEDEGDHENAETDSADQGDSEEDDEDDDEEEEEEEDDIQMGISEEIDESEIRHCRGAHLASLFIRTFFRTVRREWGSMDKYRVDKFYSLTRMYMHEIFKYMASRNWNLGIIRLFNDGLFEEVLNHRPNGLRYHLIDIALDELAKVNAKAPMPLTEATFLDTMEPYFAMCQTGAGGDVSVQSRVVQNVVEKFLLKYSVVGEVAVEEEDESNEEAKELIFDQVHVGTIAQFIFEIASDPETKDNFRKSIYDMHKLYMRRLKEAGVDVALDDFEVGDDEEGDLEGGNPAEVDVADDMDPEEAHEDDEADGAEDPSEFLTPPPKQKGKMKRKRQDDVDEMGGAEDTEGDSASKKKKKKDKKKKKKSKDSGSPTAPAEEDEVVTISLSEQKKAKKKKKASDRVEEGHEEEVKTPDSEAKHVKWKSVNRSKSHKASFKALVNASPPKTSQRTPEKSILLNKGKIRRAGVTKKAGRKKAANYF